MIRSFRVDVPQTAIDDLHARLRRALWPNELPGVGDSYGVPADRVRALAEHWLERFDWRAVEARLNPHPQFITEIDGEDIHFLHVRSPREDAVPLILTHGWPGSIVEYLDVIEPLSRRTSTWSSRRCPASGSPARPAAAAGTGTAPPAPGPS